MPQASLADVFAAVARAALDSQVRLDERLPHRPAYLYSIPKVEVNARFGVEQVQGKTFFLFGNAARQGLQNNLRFRLLSTYSTQDAGKVSATPDRTSILAPPFLVPLAEREALVASLAAELLALDGSRYSDEVDAIREAFRSGHDGDGITFLRFSPGRVLIVRLGGAREGVFVCDNAAQPALTVYSYTGSDDDSISWAPFHELAARLRQWQKQNDALVPLAGLATPPRFGSIEIAQFVRDLVAAATTAQDQLAAQIAGGSYPFRYSLQDVAADLSYTVPRDTHPELDDGAPLIRSVARVILHEGDAVDVSLLAPEYILTGAERRAFFELFDNLVQRDDSDRSGIWANLNPEYRPEYRRAVADPQRRRDAVILLSYSGPVPLNQFLVIWTGNVGSDGEERDFAFRVALKKRQLVYAGTVLPLEDPISPPPAILSAQRPFRLASVPYDGHRHELLEAFHASWVWDLSGDWFKHSS